MVFSSNEIRKNLLGCFEIFLFMPAGIKRFDSSKSAAVRSFIIPVVLLPFVMAVMVAMSSGFSVALIVPLHLGRILISLAMFLGIVYFLSQQFGRVEHFWRFITISNWSEVTATILTFPILFGLLTGQDMSSFETYAIFITIVGYVYSAFIITYAFKLPWELGGFIAIVGLAVNDNMFNVTLYLRDSLAYAI